MGQLLQRQPHEQEDLSHDSRNHIIKQVCQHRSTTPELLGARETEADVSLELLGQPA